MQRITKLTSLGIFAFCLSGCALTGDVMQAAYDNKAEEDCRAAYDTTSTTGSSCAARGESRWEAYRREDVLKDSAED